MENNRLCRTICLSHASRWEIFVRLSYDLSGTEQGSVAVVAMANAVKKARSCLRLGNLCHEFLQYQQA